MASVTIRDLADEAKDEARITAAANGRSLEAELRALIEGRFCRHKARRKTDEFSRRDGEKLTDYMQRLSHPGADFDLERDRTPHVGIE